MIIQLVVAAAVVVVAVVNLLLSGNKMRAKIYQMKYDGSLD